MALAGPAGATKVRAGQGMMHGCLDSLLHAATYKCHITVGPCVLTLYRAPADACMRWAGAGGCLPALHAGHAYCTGTVAATPRQPQTHSAPHHLVSLGSPHNALTCTCAGGGGGAGGKSSAPKLKRDRSNLSKVELNRVKRGGVGKRAFKSKSKYKRKK
jgi:hypothetical protein